MQKTVFFDIDTQKDFIYPDGNLAVPTAEKIIPNLKKLTEFAKKNDIKIIASVDRHYKNDKELKRNGGMFSDHCMDGSTGQQKINATRLRFAANVENKKYRDSYIKNLLKKTEIIVEKQSFNVFDNPNMKKLVKNVNIAIVYGVATDYGVKAAVLGLLSKKIKTYLILDAIASVDSLTGRDVLKEMKDNGAIFINTQDVLGGRFYESIATMPRMWPRAGKKHL